MAKEKKSKKDGVRVNYYLEKQIIDALDEFCERTARTKTRVIEIALKEYLERHKDDK